MKIRERESIEREEGKACESKGMGKHLKAKDGEVYKGRGHMKESGGGGETGRVEVPAWNLLIDMFMS